MPCYFEPRWSSPSWAFCCILSQASILHAFSLQSIILCFEVLHHLKNQIQLWFSTYTLCLWLFNMLSLKMIPCFAILKLYRYIIFVSLQIIFMLFISFQKQPSLIMPWWSFFFHATFFKLVLFTFQSSHVKIQEVLRMDDNGKSLRTLLLAESCDSSAGKTTPWRE